MRIKHLRIKLLFLFFVANIYNNAIIAEPDVNRTYDSLQRKLKDASEDSSKVELLLSIAKTFEKNDTALQLQYTRQALTLSEKIGWKRGSLEAVMHLGLIYGTADNASKSIYFYKQGAAIASTLKDSFNQSDAYHIIALNFQNNNQFDSSMQYYLLSLKLSSDPRHKVSLLANMGVVYANLSDFPKALENFFYALKLNQKNLSDRSKNKDDSLMHSGLLSNIGDIYIEMSQYDKAFENYNEVLSLSRQLKDSMFEMMAFRGLGKTFLFRKEFLNAAEYFKKAIEVSKAIKDPRNEAGILIDLGNVYLSMADKEQALSYTMSTQQLSEVNHYDDFLPKIYITLGRIYTAQTKYKDAVYYLQKAIQKSKELGVIADQRDGWKELSKVYELTNHSADALDAYRSYISLRDSVYNVDKARQMTSTDMQFKFDTKQMADSLRQSMVFDMKMQRQQVYTVSSVAGLALVLLLSFFIYKGYSRAKKSNTIISKANETINKEKLVSENLLLNILPRDVAEELKANGKVQAKLFDNVTVLFTDFVNFTNTSERLSPEELIEELDTCFKAFDEITAKYHVEKIKTVGDAYLAVSGLPDAYPLHATEIVKVAMEMRDFMLDRRARFNQSTFEVRLGIHSGKVIAGIVGMKKFAYDVWGDTVNIAARMEQTSEVGKINISDDTYQLVSNSFKCTYRGEIDAKNKGKMKMYFIDE